MFVRISLLPLLLGTGMVPAPGRNSLHPPPPPSLIYPQVVTNCSQFTWRGCLEWLSDELAAIKNLNVAQCHRPTEKIKKAELSVAQHDGTAAAEGGALLLLKLNWKPWVSAKIQLLGDTRRCQQANSLNTYKYFHQYFHTLHRRGYLTLYMSK